MKDTTELYNSCKEMLERLKALSGSPSIPRSAPFSRRQIIERVEAALKNVERHPSRLRVHEALLAHFVQYDDATRQYVAKPGAKPINESDVWALDANQERTCRACFELFEGEGPVCPECLEHEENKSALHDLQERESSDGLHPGHDF